MTYNNKNELVFESDEKIEYNEKQKIWWCTTLLCTLFPFFAQCVSLLFNHKFDIIGMINNGELIILTYSITVPTLIELIQIKTHKQSKQVIYVCVWFFILLSDLLVYLSMKNPGVYLTQDNKLATHDNFIINIICTIVIMVTSLIFSQKTIRYIFICNIESRQENENKKEGK